MEKPIRLHRGQINCKGSCSPHQGFEALTKWQRRSSLKRNNQITISNHFGSQVKDRQEGEKITYVHAKPSYAVCTAASYVTAMTTRWRQQMMGRQQVVHKVEYCSVVKGVTRGEHATTQVNCENIMLNERGSHRGPHAV